MTTSIEILNPKRDNKLQRALGALGAARFVTKPSAHATEQILVAWLEDLNHGQQRRELEDLVDLVIQAEGDVPVVLIEMKSAPPPRGEGLQALVHWTALLGREPYIAADIHVVRRMILAHQSKAEKELIASASIDDGRLVVWTCEPRRYEVPVASIPSLARMKPKAVLSFEVSESGSRIHWDGDDVDLTAETIRGFADPEVRQQQDAQRRLEAARYASAIRDLRERHGLRQADIQGLTERQVRRLEEGNTMPRSKTLERLAVAHGMSVDAYVGALATLSSTTGQKGRQSKATPVRKTKPTTKKGVRKPSTKGTRVQLAKAS